MSLSLLRNRKSAERRVSKRATRFLPAPDGLESRLVLSAPGAVPPVAAQFHGHGHGNLQGGFQGDANVAANLNLSLSGINITNIASNAAGQLVATGTAALSAAGQTLGTIPISLTSTPAKQGAVPILHLSLGPVDLNLLGLGVKLDNCAGGPVTVDLKAIPSSQPGGGVLGDLLIGVANLLNPSSGAAPPNPSTLTSALNNPTIVSGVNNVLTSISNALAAPSAAANPSGNTILDLHVNPLKLDLLGAQVTTSAICLTVTATPGPGNLLGNLFGDISNLLGPPGQNGIGNLLNNL